MDTVAASWLGSALVVDRRHRVVVNGRLIRGAAQAIPAFEAAAVLEPNVGLLDWDDIDQLRRMRGWSQLRDVWAETGMLALEFGHTPAEAANIIREEYRGRLTEAALAAEGPKGIRRWIGPFAGFALGTLQSFMPVSPVAAVGAGAATTAAGEVIAWSQREPPARWVEASAALSKAVQDKLASSTADAHLESHDPVKRPAQAARAPRQPRP
jgi:hypothetical protein